MRAIRAQMRSTAGPELSVVQFRTLAFLDRHPGASLSDVKDHIGLTLPSVSKLVQGLLSRGFLHRATDATDRRRNVLAATAKGKRVLERARAVTRQSLADRLEGLSSEEIERVSRALRSLRPIFLDDLWARDDAKAPKPTAAPAENGRAHRRAAAAAAAAVDGARRPARQPRGAVTV